MGDSYGRVTVAAVQAAPVVLDRDATLAKLDALIQAAADRGARIIVLPEAFVPAYPIARHSLYESGERIHLSPTADAIDGSQATLRHIALEGRVFVVGCCQYLTRAMYPADFELKEALARAPEVLCRGGSAIVAPDGRYLAGPLFGEEGILTAELDLGEVAAARQLLDVAGHYSRPDVFRLLTPPF